MSERAPHAIYEIFDGVRAHIPDVQLSGIIGAPATHTYGYHRSRDWCSSHSSEGSNDYSIVLALDKAGSGDAACALDLSFPPAEMRTVTQRLMTASRSGDPRSRPIREFFGTLNGTTVTGWDRHNPDVGGDDGYTSSDSSHLWHVHVSFYREYVDNAGVLAGVTGIICGLPISAGAPVAPQPHPEPSPAKPGPTPAGPFPLPAGQHFGLITGPDESHGGDPRYDNATIIAAIKRIQAKLVAKGFAGPVSAGWVDGRYEEPTRQAVLRFQRTVGYRQTGNVWPDDWRKLFSL